LPVNFHGITNIIKLFQLFATLDIFTWKLLDKLLDETPTLILKIKFHYALRDLVDAMQDDFFILSTGVKLAIQSHELV